MAELILYTYFRSSAAYRVRIALNLKGLSYQSCYVNLIKEGGENYHAEYTKLNPQAMVPTLVHDSRVLTQSMAIIEYLEELYPTPSLLPDSAAARAFARSIALTVACDIHPLDNLRVLDYLKQLQQDEDSRRQWYRHWIYEGFDAIETQLGSQAETEFCCGDSPSYADAFLIPQVYNAKRFECDLSRYLRINRINNACLQLHAFEQASPEKQEDFI